MATFSYAVIQAVLLLVLAATQECLGEAESHNSTVNGTQDCVQYPRQEEINAAVQEFNTNTNWSRLVTSLEAVISNDSQVYRQLHLTHDEVASWWIGRENYTQLASLLLCSGLYADTGDIEGDTMLHGAAYDGNIQFVKMLLDHNANVNKANENNITPLMAAARVGELESVKFLVQAGADTTLRDNANRTALDWATILESTETVHYLENLPH